MVNLFSDVTFFSIISNSERGDYIPLDLSIESGYLSDPVLKDPLLMERYINQFLKSKQKIIAFGGYIEKRALYERSDHFKSIDNQRNIHLGVDFWCEEESEVLCPLEGKIHGFKNNNNFGDYGPTIIIEHTTETTTFYTLYGHLSSNSIEGIVVGDSVKKGGAIAKIGGLNENGNYAPHLHFQVILDIQDYEGDYPGVCSDSELAFYRENCPDPKNFLGL